ncbi:MAG TPA: L-glutamate gamma-semialdehyde dehydrogenase [Steroidobacteraceae bacterium]|nr:L-glutamate gamma-semialdehyde dehydrogenase [Steroidobacteraceae bacterium]
MKHTTNLPIPRNEPVQDYLPGSPQRARLKAAIADVEAGAAEIPGLVGARHVHTARTVDVTSPHHHARVVAKLHQLGDEDVRAAIDAAVEAQRDWSTWSLERRAGVFLKAADLIAGPWRDRLNAATMVGQSKTVVQSEIDVACELADFLRFNVHFAERLVAEQPDSSPGMWNRVDYRPLEGFVYAISPFNFSAIGGNLATAPALLGNTVVWKPATSAALSNWRIMEVLREAGLPDGVINFVPGDAVTITREVLADPRLAGVHFTGSTSVFQSIWREVGDRIDRYRTYPRLVGETGGKNFVVAHPSADPEALAVALVRGAFEYQGQKCSAASRAYVPASLWPDLRYRLLSEISSIRIGDPKDFRTFMGAVIDRRAYDRINGYLERAAGDSNVKVLAGGTGDPSEGWFIEPTLVETSDPTHQLMREELFGPVLALYVYDDARWHEVLALIDRTAEFGLTGAVFARDRAAVAEAAAALRNTAGNFYVNDKPTGAVVGQQPFGGARASGTNDKAGSILNLLRWASPRTIKENFVPPHDVRYPSMAEE